MERDGGRHIGRRNDILRFFGLLGQRQADYGSTGWQLEDSTPLQRALHV